MKRTQIEDVLLKKGIKPVCVNGISMQPTIMKGESYYIVVKEEYNVGDIVLFSQGDDRIVHRIIRKRVNCYQTKGDNYYMSDPRITESQIIGMLICENKHKKLMAYVSILDELICSISIKLVPHIKKLKMRIFLWAKQTNLRKDTASDYQERR